MAKVKPRGSDDQILFLIHLRREKAKEVFNEILHGFRRFPIAGPRVTQILDYLTNMVQCLEMMLKLLSGSWSNHDFGGMYQSIVGHPHSNQALMDSFKEAITDQKYFLSPTAIVNFVPDIEQLYEEMFNLLKKRHPKFFYDVEIPCPDNLAHFLHDNVVAFFRHGKRKVPPGINKSQFEEWQAAGLQEFRDDVERIERTLGGFLADGHRFTIAEAGGRALH